MKNPDYAYKGKRIHIKKIIFQDQSIINEYDIIDSRLDVELGVARLLDDGTWEGCVFYGPYELPIRAENVRELARQAYAYLLDPILKD